MQVKPTANSQYYPTLPLEKLKQLSRNNQILPRLRNVVSAAAEYFNPLYVDTIHRFMLFCQAMPLRAEGDYAKAYGLFDAVFEQMIASLKIRMGHMMPKGASPERIAEEDPLWTFALFSALLLRKSWQAATDRSVTLHTKEGEPIGVWCPFAGILHEPDAYYQVKFTRSDYGLSHDVIIAGLVNRFLAPEALRWLFEHEDVWRAWWEVLLDKAGTDNPIMMIIRKVNEQQNKTVATDNHSAKVDTMSFSSAYSADDIVMQLCLWLRAGIKRQSISVNQDNSPLHITEEGTLVLLEHIIEDFLHALPDIKKILTTNNDTTKSSLSALLTQCETATSLTKREDNSLIHYYILNKAKEEIYIKGLLIPTVLLFEEESYANINPNIIPEI